MLIRNLTVILLLALALPLAAQRTADHPFPTDETPEAMGNESMGHLDEHTVSKTDLTSAKDYVDGLAPTCENANRIRERQADGSWSCIETPSGGGGIPQTAADARYLRLAGGTMTGALTLSANPAADLQAATKGYVDGEIPDVSSYQTASDVSTSINLAVANRVAKAGDTMTGALTLSGAPTTDLHAATKKYVDDNAAAGGITRTAADARYLALSGGTLAGALTLSGAPTSDLNAATKKYVDDNAGGDADTTWELVELGQLTLVGFSENASTRSTTRTKFGNIASFTGASQVLSYNDVNGKIFTVEMPSRGGFLDLADLGTVNTVPERTAINGSAFVFCNTATVGAAAITIGGIGSVFPADSTIEPQGCVEIFLFAAPTTTAFSDGKFFNLVVSPHDEVEPRARYRASTSAPASNFGNDGDLVIQRQSATETRIYEKVSGSWSLRQTIALPGLATRTSAGLMSHGDKQLVDEIAGIEHRVSDLRATSHDDWDNLPNGNAAAFRMVGVNQASTLSSSSWGASHQALLSNENYVVQMRIPLAESLAQYRLTLNGALVAPHDWSEGPPDATYRYFGGVGTIQVTRNAFVRMQRSTRSYHTTFDGDLSEAAKGRLGVTAAVQSASYAQRTANANHDLLADMAQTDVPSWALATDEEGGMALSADASLDTAGAAALTYANELTFTSGTSPVNLYVRRDHDLGDTPSDFRVYGSEGQRPTLGTPGLFPTLGTSGAYAYHRFALDIDNVLPARLPAGQTATLRFEYHGSTRHTQFNGGLGGTATQQVARAARDRYTDAEKTKVAAILAPNVLLAWDAARTATTHALPSTYANYREVLLIADGHTLVFPTSALPGTNSTVGNLFIWLGASRTLSSDPAAGIDYLELR